MVLRSVCDYRARLATAFATVAAIVVFSLIVTNMPVQAASGPVASGTVASRPADNSTVRAQELQGYLAGAGDMHYLGLETLEGAESIIITLVYRTPEGSLIHDGVNFSVMAEDGLREYLSGMAMEEAAIATGSVLLASAEGSITQAKLPTDWSGGYTVIVQNSWQTPIHYVLTVHGGALVDEGAQTLIRVPLPPDNTTSLNLTDTPPSLPAIEQQSVDKGLEIGSETTDLPNTISNVADTMSGSLQPLGDRKTFRMRPASVDGEITVRLTYETGGVNVQSGTVNFWVLTQDGLVRVKQGALPIELNLATGQPSGIGNQGEMSAAVRLGSAEAYALIVFNETSVLVDYQIDVKGANLVVSDDPVDSDNMMLSSSQTSEIPAGKTEFTHDDELVAVVSP